MLPVFRVLVVACCCLGVLAGCGGGGDAKPAVTAPKAITQQQSLLAASQTAGDGTSYEPTGDIVADNGFRPDVDGFGFENYANDVEPENMTPYEVEDIFGEGVCVRGTGDGDETYTIAIFRADGGGGHAITPFAVEDKGDGRKEILVYDNDFPGIIRAPDVDTNAVTWHYVGGTNPRDLDEVYEGGARTRSLSLYPTSRGRSTSRARSAREATPAATRSRTRTATSGPPASSTTRSGCTAAARTIRTSS